MHKAQEGQQVRWKALLLGHSSEYDTDTSWDDYYLIIFGLQRPCEVLAFQVGHAPPSRLSAQFLTVTLTQFHSAERSGDVQGYKEQIIYFSYIFFLWILFPAGFPSNRERYGIIGRYWS